MAFLSENRFYLHVFPLVAELGAAHDSPERTLALLRALHLHVVALFPGLRRGSSALWRALEQADEGGDYGSGAVFA